jgi:hypothetical protein
MNEFENQSGMEGNSDIEELREQLQALRTLVAIALVMLIGLSICADLFFSKQVQMLNTESQQMQVMAESFPVAAANDFVKRLREYAKTHPDFAPIAAKYPGLFGQGAPTVKK